MSTNQVDRLVKIIINALLAKTIVNNLLEKTPESGENEFLLTVKTALTDWLESNSEFTCPYDGCGGQIFIYENRGMGHCLKCDRDVKTKSKLYTTEKL